VQLRALTTLSDCAKSMRNPNAIAGYPLGMIAWALDFSTLCRRSVLLAGKQESDVDVQSSCGNSE